MSFAHYTDTHTDLNEVTFDDDKVTINSWTTLSAHSRTVSPFCHLSEQASITDYEPNAQLDDMTSHSFCVEVELSAPSYCVAKRVGRSDDGVSGFDAEGFRALPHSLHGRRNKELAGIAEKVVKSIRREVEQKGLKLSITAGGKQGKRARRLPCAASWKRSFENAVKEKAWVLRQTLEREEWT